jgi:RNA polymerase sigma-70 factor (ECF subfamily)
MTDIELINSILEGKKENFRAIVERHQNMVFRTAMGFLHNKEDADDLTQEVFIQAYQALKSFKQQSAFSTWLYRITVNAALNKVRKESKNKLLQKFESLFSSDKHPAFILPDNDNPENIIIYDEHREWVQRALNSLPENQRTAIVLSKYDELPQKEIAEIMNTTEGAVEALIQRAKANLREKLSSSLRKK